MRPAFFVLALLLACLGAPAAANIVTPPSYDELMTDSTVVVIGTVTDVDRRANRFGRNGPGATATLSVQYVVKGEVGASVTVRIYHPVAELNPRCCEIGATYMAFLRPSASDGQLFPVATDFGMVRIGAPPATGRAARPTFQQLMAESWTVIIGTVTRTRLEQSARESRISLAVHQVLKGTPMQTFEISNDEDANPRCCRVGATFIMFLQPAAGDGRAISPWNADGIVRIAPPPTSIEVIAD